VVVKTGALGLTVIGRVMLPAQKLDVATRLKVPPAVPEVLTVTVGEFGLTKVIPVKPDGLLIVHVMVFPVELGTV
jgi:hypothetical protein